MRDGVAENQQSGALVLLCLAAWAIPGAGHLWLGRRAKGLVFLVALPLMFAIGLAIAGPAVPVRFLPSRSSVLHGPRRSRASACRISSPARSGLGAGDVRAVTYEYGNAFLIVAGLLNLLVVIDAYDIALGRK